MEVEMRKIKAFAAVGAAVVVGLCLLAAVLYRETSVTGDQFRTQVLDSYRVAYASWYLYGIEGNRYCFRYSRPVVPARVCVPSSEIEIRNGGDGSAVVGYVFEGEFIPKVGGRADPKNAY
jgi:hypothetical protein